MEINGWRYDFTSLPYWNIRDEIPYVYDSLYENRHLDMAFLIYSIVERGMLNYSGFLAILQNKKDPELLFQVEKSVFDNSEIVFSMDGNLVFIKSSLWKDGWPVFIFNPSARRFAYLKPVIRNFAFTIKEGTRNEFAFVVDEGQLRHDNSGMLVKQKGVKIEIEALMWMPLACFDSFLCTI